MIKVSDYVLDFVARQGVRHVFLLPGGGSMHLVDSLGSHTDLVAVGCLHEQAVAFAAEAYAQFTGGLGVGLVTTGPGGTNAITGVAAAWIDSTPLLIISGQAKRADLIGASRLRQRGVQEVDVVSICRPITKFAVTVMEPSQIRYVLEQAVHTARSGRPGPVWVDIPLDVQGATIDESRLAPFTPEPASAQPVPVQQIIALLEQSERPVVLAGNGIRLAKCKQAFCDLVERLQVPVLTTWKAADLLGEDHPLFFGRPGSIAHRGANFVLQNADLLVSIGARLDLPQVGFNYQFFARGAKKVIIDVDPPELAKLAFPIDLAIADDAGRVVEALASADPPPARRPAWIKYCRDMRARHPLVTSEQRAQVGYVNTYVFIEELAKLLTPEDVLVPGSSGACAEITMQAFPVKLGQRVLNSPGLGAMGTGLPAAIGACIAAGGRRTVTIIGDGGLQHNIQELATVAHRGLPLKIFILDNHGYGSIRATQNKFFAGRFVCCDPESGLPMPDTLRIAAAYGLPTAEIRSHEELPRNLAEVLARPGPVLCNVVGDQTQPTMPRLASAARPDGSMVSKPLEDLWPFLDRDAFRENMLIPPLDEN